MEFSGTTSHNQKPDLQSFPHRRKPQARSRLVAVRRSSRAIRKRSRDEERNNETAASHEQYREVEKRLDELNRNAVNLPLAHCPVAFQK
jgi:hypothetical protein